MAKGDLLYELHEFMRERSYIVGDAESIKDMVNRYANPPLTMYRRVAMQMTIDEYKRLNELLERIDKVVEKERHNGG